MVFGDTTQFTDLRFRTPQLYRDLCERVENVLQERKNIEDDLTQSEVQTNLNLRNILESTFREKDEILTKFTRQLLDYGDPPEGFEGWAQRLRQEINIVEATNAPVLEQGPTEPELILAPIVNPERHASSKAILKENARRTLEGAMRPWKKWFGSKR